MMITPEIMMPGQLARALGIFRLDDQESHREYVQHQEHLDAQ